MNDESTQDFLLANVGAPFLIGLAVGYFAKKTLKMALFMGGLAIVLLFVSEYYGFTTVSDEGLKQTTTMVVDSLKGFGGFLSDRLSRISSKGLSAVAGFAAGLKFG